MPSIFNPADRADILHMCNSALPGIPTLLDFSNDLHNRFYLKQLDLAGIDREQYPEQFSVLERTREKHTLKGAQTTAAGDGTVPVRPVRTGRGFNAERMPSALRRNTATGNATDMELKSWRTI
ncbi:MAG TPA: hypothetical protein VHI13_02075 [Candidatus Kapabacteria bacterium]|nr:hypothetical protein [Candidatus Kapabacteria bacterium]